MARRYAKLARIYGIIALCAGVFYREFTKLHGFYGHTSLIALHVHYFTLGMMFFLLLALAEKQFAFSELKMRQLLPYYQAGLNLTGLAFLARGVCQVLGTASDGFGSSLISGIAGIGHILLGVSLVVTLCEICKKAE